MGSDGGCRAELCFKSSVTMSWERRWEFVRLGSAGQAFGEMSDPTCAGTTAYGIALSFSVLLLTLYLHNFLQSIFRERT